MLYPDFLIGWLALAVIYALCVGPLRHRFPGSEPVGRWQVASFAFGMSIMLVALQGPLHDLSDHYLFSAHMVQHLLVMLLMPPFLLLGTPGWLIRPSLRIPGMQRVARVLVHPATAFLLVNLIFGYWHLAGSYDLMMRAHTVHKLMHLMIMAVGVLLWWPVFSPLPELPPIAGPVQMVYLFLVGVPMMAVAVLLFFSDTHYYPWYAEAPRRLLGLSPLEDQRLGALIMWVPGGLVMWLGITFSYFRWSRREIREDERYVGIDRPGESGVRIAAPPFPEPRLRNERRT